MAKNKKNLIPGFSWKRATGITGFKQKVARTTGIPTTKEGRKRKAERSFLKLLGLDKLFKKVK